MESPELDKLQVDFGSTELLLPEQYNDLNRRSGQLSSDLRLVEAVLEDAARCYLGDGVLQAHSAKARASKKHAERIEAEAWFTDDSQAPFGFLWCCDVLGIQPKQFIRTLAYERFTYAGRLVGRLSGKPLDKLSKACSRGHLFDEANTQIRTDGRRQCRTCCLAAQRMRRHKVQLNEECVTV